MIGAAAKFIPEDLRANAPGVPWKYMVGMCDKLVHRYFGVDLSIVWTVVKDELPPLRPDIERLMSQLETQPGEAVTKLTIGDLWYRS